MTQSRSADTDTIDLADVARTIRRGWASVLVGVACGLAIAVAVLMVFPARFKGTSTVVLRASESSTGSLSARIGGSIAGAASGLLPSGLTAAPIETEIQILSSRAIAGEVVDSLRLQLRLRSGNRIPPWQLFTAANFSGSFKRHRLHFEQSTNGGYTVTGIGTAVTALPGTSTPIGDGSLTLGQGKAAPQFDIDVYDREEAITRFLKRLSVSKVAGEVVSITYAADDSLSAAQVPNLIIRRYVARRKTTDRGLNERRADFLTAQVDSIERTLTAAEAALRQQQERSGVLDPVVVGKLELERAGELRRSSGTLDVERGALSLLLTQLGTGQLTSTQIAAFPTFLKSSGINDLLGQLSTLQTKRLQLLATLTPDEPSVVAASEGIKSIEAQIPALARAYAISLDRQRADVARQLDTLRSAIEQLPAAGEASVRLQRRVLGLSQVSAALRAQLVEARLATVGEGGDVRLLDVAQPPRKISFPEPLLTLLIGLVGGLIIGAVLALIVGSWGKYIRDPHSIEQIIGAPVLSLDDNTPFVVAGVGNARAVLVISLDRVADSCAVAERLLRTATARGLRSTVVDLADKSGNTLPAGATLSGMAAEHDLVIVRLGALASDATVALLDPNRPVLLAATANRVRRDTLSAAVRSLERLSVPCAGLVLCRRNGRSSNHV